MPCCCVQFLRMCRYQWRYFPRVIWSQSVLNLEALGLVNGKIEYLI